MLTVYTLTYNEEIVLPYFIKHYRSRFPNCEIVIYDNYSTDATKQIALNNNCTVIPYDSNNEIRDDLYIEIKNNCWKQCKTEWCIVLDCDEFLEVNVDLLKNATFNAIEAHMCEMYGESTDIDLIDSGVIKAAWKKCCWKVKDVIETNFKPGAHHANFVGNVTFNKEDILFYHFKNLSLEYVVNRYKLFLPRLGEINTKNGWSYHYRFTEAEIKYFYDQLKRDKIKVR